MDWLTNANFTGRATFSGVLPFSLAASQNNWSPSGLSRAFVLSITNTGGLVEITGLDTTGFENGRLVVIECVGSTGIVLKFESASSTAANRFVADGGYSELSLAPNASVMFRYDTVQSRLVLLNNPQTLNTTALNAAYVTLSTAQTIDASKTINPATFSFFNGNSGTPLGNSTTNCQIVVGDVTNDNEWGIRFLNSNYDRFLGFSSGQLHVVKPPFGGSAVYVPVYTSDNPPPPSATSYAFLTMRF